MSGHQAFLHCVGLGCEAGTNAFPCLDVGRRISPRRAAQRPLMNEYGARQAIRAQKLVVGAGPVHREIPESPRNGSVEHIVYERRLARSTRPGNGADDTKRETHVDGLQVMRARTAYLEPGGSGSPRASDLAFPRPPATPVQIWPPWH